jgi:tRNA-dihydrouridine synthase
MIGRLAVRAPWIFAQVRGSRPDLPGGPAAVPAPLPEKVNLEETAIRFLELLAAYQPREFLLSRARRFFSFFWDNLLWGSYIKNLLAREPDLSSMARVLSAYFREHPEERMFPVPRVRL